MAKKITSAKKNEVMTGLLKTAAGRQKLAATITEPLRQVRDYTSIARRAFMIDELPDGALPTYDMDPTVPAFVVGEAGDSVTRISNTQRMLVPIFEMASNPRVKFSQVKERRFDIVRRLRDKTKSEIFRLEDRRLFGLMEQTGLNNSVNLPINVTPAQFSINTLADAFANVESQGHRVDKIFLNPLQHKIVRTAGTGIIDFETQREILKTGLLGNLWGASIFQSNEIPAGSVYIVTEPDYLGVLPVRLDLTVLSADVPAERAFGWSIFQSLGAGIHNPAGLQLVKVA